MSVTLTNAIVKQLNIDYEQQMAVAVYYFADINGKMWGDTAMAYFYVTMPPEPPDGYPENWFQLPGTYIPTLLTLQSDAASAITTRFLG